MTKKEFLDLVNIHKVILDGATGPIYKREECQPVSARKSGS